MAYQESSLGPILATVKGINGKVVGTTDLFTVPALPAGQSVPIYAAIIRLTTAVGVTGTIKIGIGVVAGEDDIFSSTNLTGFNSTGNTYIFSTTGVRKLPVAGDVIKLGIDNAFGGTTATLSVDLIGLIN